MSGRPLSLNVRLSLASALLLPLFLGLTGLTLEQAFQRSLTTATEERLQSHIYLLFSVAELNVENGEPGLSMPPALLEPDFERVNSGLYAYIIRPDHGTVWRSNSAQLIPEPPVAYERPERHGHLHLDEVTHADNAYWRARYGVIWEDESGLEQPFAVLVLKDQSGYRAELASYRGQLWRWLVGATLVLLIAQSAVLRWGLNPLNRLSGALEAMRRGDTEQLGGEHPRELQPLVDNLNQLLNREQSLRLRYRNSLSNLAHSLKTPLAVLRGHIAETRRPDPTDAEETLTHGLAEQVARMDQVVNYQLRRAVSDQQRGLRQQTAIAPALERLERTLDKVYRDKQIRFDTRLQAPLAFPGDEQDLLELLGNLLDNACKYGHQRVRVTGSEARGELVLSIEDDGPGIPSELRAQVLERGTRLDSLQPGQGIGLAVSADIVRSYGGQLTLSDSPLGGARIEISLPC